MFVRIDRKIIFLILVAHFFLNIVLFAGEISFEVFKNQNLSPQSELNKNEFHDEILSEEVYLIAEINTLKDLSKAFGRIHDDVRTLIENKNQQAINISMLYDLNNIINDQLKELSNSQEAETNIKKFQKDYFTILDLFTFIVHSQSWLAPTPIQEEFVSTVKEAGVMQGGVYEGYYERDNLNSFLLEDLLAEKLKCKSIILFRNINSLLYNLFCTLIKPEDDNQVIYCSDSVMENEVFPLKIDNISQLQVLKKQRIKKSDVRNSKEILKNIFVNLEKDIDKRASLVLHEYELGDQKAEFIKKILDSGFDIENIIIISSKTQEFFNIFQVFEFYKTKRGKTAGLYVVSDLAYNLKAVNSESFGMTTKTAFIGTMNREDPLYEELNELKTLGANLDNYTRWYLYMLLDRLDDDEFDLSNKAYFYDTLKSEYFLKRIESFAANYNNLSLKVSQFKKDFENVRSIYYKQIFILIEDRIKEHLRDLVKITGNKGKLSKRKIQVCRTAFSEYRTLLKYLVFFSSLLDSLQNQNQENLNLDLSELEFKLNQLIKPYFVEQENILKTTSSIFSSGMGASSSIAHFLFQECKRNKQELLVGDNVYYEFMENPVLKFVDYSGVKETDTEQIINQIKTEQFSAIFIDPISNQLFQDKKQFLEILPVADMKEILNQLLKIQFKHNFYLVLDLSLFGNQFQISDILKSLEAKEIPENFSIIIFQSLQKLHQDGLEVSPGGLVSVISNDMTKSADISNNLKHTRKILGLEPSVFNVNGLNLGVLDEKKLKERTLGIMSNAEEFSAYIYHLIENYKNINQSLDSDSIFHPSLENHLNRDIWLKNNKPGVPFFGFSLHDPDLNANFLKNFGKELLKEGLGGLEHRDSYGFSKMTFSMYEQKTIRFCVPAYDSEDLNKAKKSFWNALVQTLGLKTTKKISNNILRSSS